LTNSGFETDNFRLQLFIAVEVKSVRKHKVKTSLGPKSLGGGVCENPIQSDQHRTKAIKIEQTFYRWSAKNKEKRIKKKRKKQRFAVFLNQFSSWGKAPRGVLV
jgi:hypothetical protein